MACPYIDQKNPDCQKHMCLDRLDEAITICGHEYENCEIFKRLQAQPKPQLAAQHG